VKRSPLLRRTPLRTRPKPRTRQTREDAVLFHDTVCSEPCIGLQLDGHICDGRLEAMHVVPKQTLRRRNLGELRWDALNGVAGCEAIHRRHDLKVELIPRALLPQRCIDWAVAHNLTDALDRHWPEEQA
jgi:hypothetical protein